MHAAVKESLFSNMKPLSMQLAKPELRKTELTERERRLMLRDMERKKRMAGLSGDAAEGYGQVQPAARELEPRGEEKENQMYNNSRAEPAAELPIDLPVPVAAPSTLPPSGNRKFEPTLESARFSPKGAVSGATENEAFSSPPEVPSSHRPVTEDRKDSVPTTVNMMDQAYERERQRKEREKEILKNEYMHAQSRLPPKGRRKDAVPEGKGTGLAIGGAITEADEKRKRQQTYRDELEQQLRTRQHKVAADEVFGQVSRAPPPASRLQSAVVYKPVMEPRQEMREPETATPPPARAAAEDERELGRRKQEAYALELQEQINMKKQRVAAQKAAESVRRPAVERATSVQLQHPQSQPQQTFIPSPAEYPASSVPMSVPLANPMMNPALFAPVAPPVQQFAMPLPQTFVQNPATVEMGQMQYYPNAGPSAGFPGPPASYAADPEPPADDERRRREEYRHFLEQQMAEQREKRGGKQPATRERPESQLQSAAAPSAGTATAAAAAAADPSNGVIIFRGREVDREAEERRIRQQQYIQDELKKQIEEKERNKQMEKQRQRDEDQKEEQRVRKEREALEATKSNPAAKPEVEDPRAVGCMSKPKWERDRKMFMASDENTMARPLPSQVPAAEVQRPAAVLAAVPVSESVYTVPSAPVSGPAVEEPQTNPFQNMNRMPQAAPTDFAPPQTQFAMAPSYAPPQQQQEAAQPQERGLLEKYQKQLDELKSEKQLAREEALIYKEQLIRERERYVQEMMQKLQSNQLCQIPASTAPPEPPTAEPERHIAPERPAPAVVPEPAYYGAGNPNLEFSPGSEDACGALEESLSSDSKLVEVTGTSKRSNDLYRTWGRDKLAEAKARSKAMPNADAIAEVKEEEPAADTPKADEEKKEETVVPSPLDTNPPAVAAPAAAAIPEPEKPAEAAAVPAEAEKECKDEITWKERKDSMPERISEEAEESKLSISDDPKQ